MGKGGPPEIIRSRNRYLRWTVRNKYYLGSAILLFVGFLFLPLIRFTDPASTVLEDSQGELLSAKIAADGQWRFPEGDSVPYKIRQCILKYEDEYYMSHPGINPVSLTRALIRNIREGKIVSGGSTITMQVIRLSRKGRPRTLGQKLIEMILALRLEFSLSKDEILQLYASHAPFGGNVVGIEAASWRYFGRPSNKLSWGEAATMAVLPNAPSMIFPGKNHELLLAKRNRLLEKLEERGIIDRVSCDLAESEPLPGKPIPLPQLTPHLLDRAEKEGYGGTLRKTSIDRQLQVRLSDLVQRHHDQLKQNEIHNAAVLILDVPGKKVLAYVGNTPTAGEETGRYVDIISSPRSSGSILKPLLYTCMLDEGEILPDCLVPDIPTHISGYTPMNFDRSYNGAVPASTALIRSLNVPAVRLLRQYGLEKFHSKLQSLNFSTIDKEPGHYGLTLILGGAEVSLWDLCRVYSGMANSLNNIETNEYKYNSNDYADPDYILNHSGINQNGTENQAGLSYTGVMSAAAIWQCFETLTELKRPTAEGLWEQFPSSKKISWKTGTSFGFRDAWAIGVNPDYLVGVWVGNADGEGRPGLTGINMAAPLLFDAFGLLDESGWFTQPLDEMIQIEICAASGYRTGPDCNETITRTLPQACAKMEACPYHTRIHLDNEGTHRVNSDCYETDKMINTSWFLLTPVMEYYYRKRNPHYKSLPPYLPACQAGESKPMELIYPRDTRQVFIPRDLDGEPGKVVFDVAHRKKNTKIFWHLDNQYLGETEVIHQMEFFAQEGWHTLFLIDPDGNLLEKKFEIVGRHSN